MKKTSKIMVALFIIAAMLLSSFTALCSISKADEYEDKLDCYVYSRNVYELGPQEIISIYSNNSTGGPTMSYRHSCDISGKEVIPIYCGPEMTTQLQDGCIDATDASAMLRYAKVDRGSYDESVEQINAEWREDIADISRSIVKYYGEKGVTINPEDITTYVTVVTPAVEEFNITAGTYDFSINTNTGINQEVLSKMQTVSQKNTEADEDLQLIAVTAKMTDGTMYRMIVGSDDNVYLIKAEDTQNIGIDDEFKTSMTYTALDKTTEDDGNVFLAPYTDNDNPKKDSDVTVTIKSENKQKITSVVVGETSAELSKDANSLGWFYPDESDKTVIAKVYPFDTYDNTTYAGNVSEKVGLISENGDEDTQNPKIKWTFRRKTKEETENNDGSVTIVITYNLPIDKDKIPNGWEAIYDQDGKTVHKITKTIKKGNNYKEDVTVKQYGTDATVTTTVEKVWNLPQTGEMWIFIAAGIAGLTIFTISRRRKISKM